MQVWNMLHVARWKYRTQTWRKKLPSAHHRATLSGCIFATKAYIDNWKKIVKQRYVPHMPLQYGERQPTNGRERFGSLGHPSKFQWHSCLGFLAAAMSRNGNQPNFARCLAICCAAEHATHIPRAAITLDIGPHCIFVLFMAALCNRGHYIFALWFLSSIYLFFPRLISAAAGWMSTILWHMVWP